MEFTTEQQAFIDASFGKRFAEIQAKAEAKRVEDIAAVKAELAAQIAAKDSELAETKKASGSKKDVDDSAAVARVAALEQKWKQANERAARESLKSIAAELNAVNAEHVASLINGNVKIDEDGNFTVINAAGQPRLNAESKPMAIREYMTEFLTEYPHHVKASGQTGAGSTSAVGLHGAGAALKTVKRGDFLKLSAVEQMKFATTAGNTITD